MPLYDYKCHDCGTVTEFLINSDSHQPACPGCGSRNMKRQISAPSLLKNRTNTGGKTCCGREERCETPACATGTGCRRH
jgi:putative FmdB family regulatory protein